MEGKLSYVLVCLSVSRSVSRSVGQLVGYSVCHNCLKGREKFHFPAPIGALVAITITISILYLFDSIITFLKSPIVYAVISFKMIFTNRQST